MTCCLPEVPVLLREKLQRAMETLGLHGMKTACDELIATGIKQRATPEKILFELLNAELAERRIRSIRYRLSQAKFPVEKDLDHFEFAETPINEAQVRMLYEGGFLTEKSNIILVEDQVPARRIWPLPLHDR